jgi:hypothetical protein
MEALMAQPQPPNTRQSEGKEVPKKGTLHDLKPGGPIKPTKQGYVNPGPTDNLRGVEPNTAMHKGTPNPQQQGSHGPIGDYVHDPGKGQADEVHGHGIQTPVEGNKAVAKHHSAPIMHPAPNPKGVRK